jgi:malate/lactate dehydrogenase
MDDGEPDSPSLPRAAPRTEEKTEELTARQQHEGQNLCEISEIASLSVAFSSASIAKDLFQAVMSILSESLPLT